MTYLVLLKRFEIWLLLGVVGGIFYFAFSPETTPVPEPAAEPESVVLTATLPEPEVEVPEEEAPEPALAVGAVRSEAAEGGDILAITLLARSLDGTELTMDEKTLKATTNGGAPVPRFFAPFRETPRISSEEPTEIELKFWLARGENETAADTLWLDFQGERTEAKIPGNG